MKKTIYTLVLICFNLVWLRAQPIPYYTEWASTQPGSTPAVEIAKVVKPTAWQTLYVAGIKPGMGASDDIYVEEWSQTGTRLRNILLIGGPGTDDVTDMFVDSLGNFYLVGSMTDEVDFGSGTVLPFSAGKDMFVAKYDSAGVYQWANAYGAGGDDVATAIDVVGDSVYVAGYFVGTVLFGTTTLVTLAGATDGVVLKLHKNTGQGSNVMHFSTPSGSFSKIVGLKVDKTTNNFYVLGTNLGTTAAPNGAGTFVASLQSSFLIKYSNQSTHIWSFPLGGSAISNRALTLELDVQNNPIVGGNFSGDFEANPLGASDLAVYLIGAASSSYLIQYAQNSGLRLSKYVFGTTQSALLNLTMTCDLGDRLHVGGTFFPSSTLLINGNNLPASITSVNSGFLASFEMGPNNMSFLDVAFIAGNTANNTSGANVLGMTAIGFEDYVVVGQYVNSPSFNYNAAATQTAPIFLSSISGSDDAFLMKVRVAKVLHPDDSLAMMLLRDSTNGLTTGGWSGQLMISSNNGWNMSVPAYNWYGVTDILPDPINIRFYRIKRIEMQNLFADYGVKMSGSLPNGLFDAGRLEHLEYLILDNNDITNGPSVPWDMAPNLGMIKISNNQFSYDVDLLNNMALNAPNLYAFEASNYLSAGQQGNPLLARPASPAPYIPNLQIFDLSRNGFTGSFWSPDSISTNLEIVKISHNNISSFPMPNQAIQAPIRVMELDSNLFSDPYQLNNMLRWLNTLEVFTANEAMNANIHPAAGFQMNSPVLQIVNISNNRLVIPYLGLSSLATSIEQLRCSNNLIDSVYAPMSVLPNLEILDLSRNRIRQSVSSPASIGFFKNIPNVYQLNLGQNLFYGELPNPAWWSDSSYNFTNLTTFSINKTDTAIYLPGIKGDFNLQWMFGKAAQLPNAALLSEVNIRNNDLSDMSLGNILQYNRFFSGFRALNVSKNRLEFDDLYNAVRAFNMVNTFVSGATTSHYLTPYPLLDIITGAADTLSFNYKEQRPDGVGGVRRRSVGQPVLFDAEVGMPVNAAGDTLYHRIVWNRALGIDTLGLFDRLELASSQVVGYSQEMNSLFNIFNNSALGYTSNSVFVNPDANNLTHNHLFVDSIDNTHPNFYYAATTENDSFPQTKVYTLPKFLSMGPCIDSLGQPIMCQQIIVEFDQFLLSQSNNPDSLKNAVRDELGMKLIDTCICGTVELWATSDTAALELLQLGTGTRRSSAQASSKAELLNASPNYPLLDAAGGNFNTSGSAGTATHAKPAIVAIIDSGTDYDHPQLTNRIWRNAAEVPNNGIDDDGNCIVDDVIGYDFLNKSNQPFDDHGHGTEIAGIITGQSTNNILPNSSSYDSVAIVPIKYTDKAGRGSIFHATCGIYYASNYWSANSVDTNRVKVVNASWGYYGEPNPTLRKAMDYAADNCGMLFVCAAGNSGLDNDTIAHYPSNFWMDNVISVAAVNSAAVNNLAAYSNYGLLSVDIAAVGDVTTTEAGGGTISVQGTSFATAQVSRAAALLFHQYPDATYYAVKYALVRGVDTLQSNDSIKIQSRGRLNLAKSMTVLDSLSLRSVCSNALFLDVPQVGSVATNASVSIYPNPFSNRLQVEILNVEEEAFDLRLLSIEGSLLWQYQMPVGQNSTTIPVEILSPGMYILQIQGKTLRTTEKIVKFE